MLYLINQKRTKPNRHYYFHMVIMLASIESNINLSKMQTTSLADLIINSYFISQKILESILFNLIITDRDRRISFKDFDGQLQSDSRGIPYWNIYLQTTALVTSRCLKKKMAKHHPNDFINSTINISSISRFKRCKRKKLFSIPESDFQPGHFSKTVLTFEELLENNQVKEAIKESPEKYRLLMSIKDR